METAAPRRLAGGRPVPLARAAAPPPGRPLRPGSSCGRAAEATGRPIPCRRHVGSPAKFAVAARQTEEWLDRFGLLAPGIAQVLDLGCGCGSMAPGLRQAARREAPPTSASTCTRPRSTIAAAAFAGDGRFRFALAEVASPYGGQAGPAAEALRLPAARRQHRSGAGEIGLQARAEQHRHIVRREEIRRAVRANETRMRHSRVSSGCRSAGACRGIVSVFTDMQHIARRQRTPGMSAETAKRKAGCAAEIGRRFETARERQIRAQSCALHAANA